MSRYAFGIQTEDGLRSYSFDGNDNKEAYTKVADLLVDWAGEQNWEPLDWDIAFNDLFLGMTVHVNHPGPTDHTYHVFDTDRWSVTLVNKDTRDGIVSFDAYNWVQKYGLSLY